MTTLEDALLALLTAHPEPADALITELRQWTKGGVYKGDQKWMPGHVLDALDRLCLHGKALLVPGRGYRRMPERGTVKVLKQRSLLG